MLEFREHAGDVLLAEEVQRPEIVEDTIDFGGHPARIQGVMHQDSRYAPGAGRPGKQVIIYAEPGSPPAVSVPGCPFIEPDCVGGPLGGVMRFEVACGLRAIPECFQRRM